ncbi:MAG: hypothetical protein OEY96_07795 [Gammaproteobacteria bacterium]|nr:hypothetical protein [Gammaproteobacteria bacterium]
MSKIITILFLSFSLMSTGVNAQSIMEVSTQEKVFYAKTNYQETEWNIRWSKNLAVAGEKIIYVDHPDDRCEETFFQGRVISIVGNYVSVEKQGGGYCMGAAHPYQYKTFETIDITTGKKVSLKDIFDENEIFEALMKDGVIQNTLKGKVPNNLKDLFSMADGGCDYAIYDFMLGSFAFHHLNGSRVAVRIGVGHGCEVNRGAFTQLGMYLKIPESLMPALKSAEAQDLLMNKMGRLSYEKKQ